MFFGIIISLVMLLLPVALIAAIVVAVLNVRRRDEETQADEPGIGTVRRLFVYGVATVALVLVASGLALLVGGALDAVGGDALLSSSDSALASALALTVVGTPAWLIMLLFAQRSVQRYPVEQRSEARRAYFNLARGGALVAVAIAGVLSLRILFGVDQFEGDPFGWLVVSVGVWVLHIRMLATEPATTSGTRLLDRLYLYAGAILGLYLLWWSATDLLVQPVRALYGELFDEVLLVADYGDPRAAIAAAAIAVPVWWWHWIRHLARRDARTSAWYTYLFIAGITTASAVFIVSLARVLYAILDWWTGDPQGASAVEHFADLPAALGAAIVSGLLWGYHRAVLRDDAPEVRRWSTPEHAYRYLTAASGLLTASVGLVALIALVIEVVAGRGPDLLRSADWWRNDLVLGLTCLLVGVPLWVRYWSQAQDHADEGLSERQVLPRRVFLFSIFGLAVLVALIDLTVVLYQVFRSLLDGTSGTLLAVRWNLALVLVAGVVGIYYWLILREDQRLLPGAPRSDVAPAPLLTATSDRLRRIIVMSGAGADLARSIETVPGVRIEQWQRLDATDGVPSAEELAALRAAIEASEDGDYLLLHDGGRTQLIPYSRVPHVLERPHRSD